MNYNPKPNLKTKKAKNVIIKLKSKSRNPKVGLRAKNG